MIAINLKVGRDHEHFHFRRMVECNCLRTKCDDWKKQQPLQGGDGASSTTMFLCGWQWLQSSRNTERSVPCAPCFSVHNIANVRLVSVSGQCARERENACRRMNGMHFVPHSTNGRMKAAAPSKVHGHYRKHVSIMDEALALSDYWLGWWCICLKQISCLSGRASSRGIRLFCRCHRKNSEGDSVDSDTIGFLLRFFADFGTSWGICKEIKDFSEWNVSEKWQSCGSAEGVEVGSWLKALPAE